jgi:hypothetical protein
MAKQPFFPRTVPKQITWLNDLVDKLQDPVKGYAAKYNVDAAIITRLDNGRQWINCDVASLALAEDAVAKLLGHRDAVMSGKTLPTVPTAPLFSAPPNVPAEPNVMGLATSVGTQIKSATNYDPADGADLGLEGTDIPALDPATAQPDLSKSRLTTGGKVEIVWLKGGFGGIKIMVDRGDGKGAVFLDKDSSPNYIDNVVPAPGTSAIYTYTAIYLVNDQEFGQWSLPFAITVRG